MIDNVMYKILKNLDLISQVNFRLINNQCYQLTLDESLTINKQHIFLIYMYDIRSGTFPHMMAVQPSYEEAFIWCDNHITDFIMFRANVYITWNVLGESITIPQISAAHYQENLKIYKHEVFKRRKL